MLQRPSATGEFFWGHTWVQQAGGAWEYKAASGFSPEGKQLLQQLLQGGGWHMGIPLLQLKQVQGMLRACSQQDNGSAGHVWSLLSLKLLVGCASGA